MWKIGWGAGEDELLWLEELWLDEEELVELLEVLEQLLELLDEEDEDEEELDDELRLEELLEWLEELVEDELVEELLELGSSSINAAVGFFPGVCFFVLLGFHVLIILPSFHQQSLSVMRDHMAHSAARLACHRVTTAGGIRIVRRQ